MPLRLMVLGAALVVAACSARKATVSSPQTPLPAHGATFIDLEPGWRLSVITPITRSGRRVLDEMNAATAGEGQALSVTLSAGSDFLGYEQAYYEVSRRRGRLQIALSSATLNSGDKQVRRDGPTVRLFQLPGDSRYVRLVYLVRASRADHNMAVLAAATAVELESLTVAVQDGAAELCSDGPGTRCSWVPAGIAVRPELRNAAGEWLPAR